jgi:hypothetical protein
MRKLTLVIFLLLVSVPPLQAQTSYYQGKTMTIVVGTVAGDLYDLYARAIALYMGKYIPGNPNIIVQNMPGAGHMIAANYIYNVAKPDGLTIAPKCGTTGMSNMGYFVPKLLEETVGAKFNVVSGYQGGNEIDLAVERGEIQCRSLSSEAFFSREPFHTWRKNNFARVLVQGGRKRDERLRDVPTLYELMDKYQAPESGRRLATALLASGDFHRPYLGPPNMRPEQVKTLREAFSKTVKDPAFLAETKNKKLDIDPTSGEEVEALTKEVMSQPPEVIERLKKLMGK